MFQRYSLFPHLTVLGNLMLGLELRRSWLLGRLFGARRREAVVRAPRALLETVGLTGARDKYPAQLSGGMQQRLSIAQSVICEPAILLLDEPFGALDPGITADMHKLILELWSANAMTIFMVTHDLKEGFELGTRLLVFDKVRQDPQAPEAYGAKVTYDIPLRRAKSRSQLAGRRRRWTRRLPASGMAAGAASQAQSSARRGREQRSATGELGAGVTVRRNCPVRVNSGAFHRRIPPLEAATRTARAGRPEPSSRGPAP